MSKGKQYYGGYFWVAVVSFIVPFVVAAKAFNELAPTTKPTPVLDASGVDHAVWDYLLKSYVTGGLVDYKGMRKDHLFREYLRELGAADIDALATSDEKLALCCNAYNAFVINGVVSHKITDTVSGFNVDGVDFFDIKQHIFGGKTMSLNDLEHGFVRPTFKDPRIHVALVCAARSCPGLRSEAYVGSRVQDQLEDQSNQFANNPTYVSLVTLPADEKKPERSAIQLSPILNWYGQDWDELYPNGGYLEWIEEYAENGDVQGALPNAINGSLEVAFATYDWSLNSQATPGASADSGGHSGGFGSGTVPNE